MTFTDPFLLASPLFSLVFGNGQRVIKALHLADATFPLSDSKLLHLSDELDLAGMVSDVIRSRDQYR